MTIRIAAETPHTTPVAAASSAPPPPSCTPTNPKAFHHLVGGVVAGLTEAAVFCPPDQAILRARLRTDAKVSVRSELQALTKAGFRAMYRGVGPDLLGTAIRRGMFPPSLHVGKGVLSDLTGKPVDSLFVCLMAGGIAGAIDPLGTNPTGRLRTVIQAPVNTDKRLNGRSAMRLVRKNEGLAGLYKGLPTNMVRGSTYCMVIAATLQGLDNTLPKADTRMWYAFNSPTEWRKVATHLGAAVTAVVAVSPLDVLLARKQQTVGGRQSVLKIASKLVREEGVRHLFTGTAFKVGMLAPRQALSLYFAGRITERLFGEHYDPEDGSED